MNYDFKHDHAAPIVAPTGKVCSSMAPEELFFIVEELGGNYTVVFPQVCGNLRVTIQRVPSELRRGRGMKGVVMSGIVIGACIVLSAGLVI